MERIGSDPGHVSDETLERGVPKVATDWTLDRPPHDAEVQGTLKLMRESAASGDEVTVRMMKLAGQRFRSCLARWSGRCGARILQIGKSRYTKALAFSFTKKALGTSWTTIAAS